MYSIEFLCHNRLEHKNIKKKYLMSQRHAYIIRKCFLFNIRSFWVYTFLFLYFFGEQNDKMTKNETT